MPQTYNEQGLITDIYTPLTDLLQLPSSQHILVSSALWHTERDILLKYTGGKIGIEMSSDEEPEIFADDLVTVDLIAINFPVFTDGRGFSIARILRDYYQYNGEIRATGNIILDQLPNLIRCGFTSFVMDERYNSMDIQKTLNTFSAYYQDSIDLNPTAISSSM